MIQITCLCAEWCSACRAYRPTFEHASRAAPAGVRFVWIDIEDHPDVIGEAEIETFPTLLVAEDERVAFFGPVEPHAMALAALLDRVLQGSLGPVEDATARAIASRAMRHTPR